MSCYLQSKTVPQIRGRPSYDDHMETKCPLEKNAYMPQRDNQFNLKITLNIGECIHLLIKDYSHFLSSRVTECIYYLLLHKKLSQLKTTNLSHTVSEGQESKSG